MVVLFQQNYRRWWLSAAGTIFGRPTVAVKDKDEMTMMKIDDLERMNMLLDLGCWDRFRQSVRRRRPLSVATIDDVECVEDGDWYDGGCKGDLRLGSTLSKLVHGRFEALVYARDARTSRGWCSVQELDLQLSYRTRIREPTLEECVPATTRWDKNTSWDLKCVFYVFDQSNGIL